MKRIKITAARWHQKTDSGYIHHRTGDVIEVPDREAERLIAAGAAVTSRAKLTDPDAETDTIPEPEADPDAEEDQDEDITADLDVQEEPADPEAPIERPKDTDTTDKWRAYAISQGMPADEAKDMTRTELRKHYS